MFKKILSFFSGSHYKKFLKECNPTVRRINELEESYHVLSDEDLKAKTQMLKDRYQEVFKERTKHLADIYKDYLKRVEVRQQVLDELLPEAFAVVKNVARRLLGKPIIYVGIESTWDMVHYDVQLIGGIALHKNYVAEMATGEGKTFVATLPLYLNALTGLNCQLATVNEYLAQRDAEWMGRLYDFLGITVGILKNGQSLEEKKAVYACDILYGTASELGFDYLRDNGMAMSTEGQNQKGHYFCIIDEVDSILIDEARTPLIISGVDEQSNESLYAELNSAVQHIVQKQHQLCNQLINQSKTLIDSSPTAKEAFPNMLLTKLGMPKNRILAKLIENPLTRRSFEKYENEMSSDFNKRQFFEFKEGLYYIIDERDNDCDLTEQGHHFISGKDKDAFVLPDLSVESESIDADTHLSIQEKNQAKKKLEDLFAQRSEKIHCIAQLLKAYSLYERDQQYVVHEDKVCIVDENTGRMMPGRRWADGLHQAVEAKEGVTLEKESKTYATVTLQNYFRMYEKLAGMTGTAETESQEFYEIYGLKVMIIPTNKPCIRVDANDVVYKTRKDKYNAILVDILEAHKVGRPVLVGTVSVEVSELLSRMLKLRKISHSVLNAKYHQQEAQIIASAGQKNAIVIATQYGRAWNRYSFR